MVMGNLVPARILASMSMSHGGPPGTPEPTPRRHETGETDSYRRSNASEVLHSSPHKSPSKGAEPKASPEKGRGRGLAKGRGQGRGRGRGRGRAKGRGRGRTAEPRSRL